MPLSELFNPLSGSSKRLRAHLRERVGVFYVENIYKHMIRLAPRSLDDYSTHLPVLCALATLIRPTRIVEYGSGLISTATFLNRTIFTELNSLLSFENNSEWHEKVANQIGHDRRLQLRVVDGPMMGVVSDHDIFGADLVFVDDQDSFQPSVPRRSDTIAAIAAIRPSRIPIVIHDIEVWHLHRSAGRFDHMFRFDGLHPQTGVAWNDRWGGAAQLPALNRLIRRFCKKVSSRDLAEWALILEQRERK